VDIKQREDLIIGRNPVLEALRAGRTIDSVLVASGEKKGTIVQILGKCRERGIVVKEVASSKLDFMCVNQNHQGVVAVCAMSEYAEIEEIFGRAAQRGEDLFVLICDEIEDPHNLGALIRTAEVVGAHGVIIPKRRSASLTFSTAKASAGAVEYIPVCKVSSLVQAIDALKAKGVWVHGADMNGRIWHNADLKGPVAIVIGSEGKGLGALVKKKCDGILSLPVRGQINSLNASVAGGVLMYEVARQRMEADIKG